MNKINKKINYAFNKKIYLLGKDKNGYNVYLEAPSWDCNWYWGFGYIERYTNKTRPDLAKDISSHTHWNYSIVGKQEIYSFEKQCWINREYIHHINNNPDFKSTVLTDKESWELSELMKKFYILKETADLFYNGSAGISISLNDKFENKELYNKINHELMPLIFKRIDELLSPEKEVKKDKKPLIKAK